MKGASNVICNIHVCIFESFHQSINHIHGICQPRHSRGIIFYYNSHFTKFYLLFTVLEIHEQHWKFMPTYTSKHSRFIKCMVSRGTCSLPRNRYIPESCENKLFYTINIPCACTLELSLTAMDSFTKASTDTWSQKKTSP